MKFAVSHRNGEKWRAQANEDVNPYVIEIFI